MIAQGTGIPAAYDITRIYAQRSAGISLESIYSQPVTGSVPDTVDLSGDAVAQYDLMKMMDTSEILFARGGERATKTLGEVRQDLQEDFAGFEEMFGGILRRMEQAFGGGEGISMQLDGKGRVLMGVGDEEPSRHTKLGDTPVFAARFALIAARSALVNLSETDGSFKDDYQTDAIQAVKDHIGSLKDRFLGYKMNVENGEISSDFA